MSPAMNTIVQERVGAPGHPKRVLDADALSAAELQKAETAADIRASVLEYEYGGEWGEAKDYSLALTDALGRANIAQNNALAREYAEILLLSQWVAFSYLPISEQLALLREHMLAGLANNLDIRAKLYATLSLEAREENVQRLRTQMIDAIRSNTERLGEAQIAVAGEEGQQAATVRNWLADYDQKNDIDQGRAAIEEEQYVGSDANTRALAPEQKNVLRKLLQLYDFLFFPDLQEDAVLPGGSPAGGARIGAPRVASEPPAPPKTGAPSAIPGGRMLERARALMAQTGGDAKTVRDALDKSVRARDSESALGSLMLLAQLRILDTVLQDDERFRALVLDDLKKNGAGDTVQGFAINPTAPQFVARFLKIVLEDRLGLRPEEAVRFGGKLAVVLALEGEKYGRIVTDNKWNL